MRRRYEGKTGHVYSIREVLFSPGQIHTTVVFAEDGDHAMVKSFYHVLARSKGPKKHIFYVY